MAGTESPRAGLDERALDAVTRYAAVSEIRARLLVDAVKAVAAEEALQIVTGEATVFGSLSDTRVERLRLIVAYLDSKTPPPVQIPTAYELATLWRITESQARSLLRTWRARHPEIYEASMTAAAAKGESQAGGGEGSRLTWVVAYDDPDVLAHAEILSRRSGLSKGLKVDRLALTIEAPQDVRSHDDQNLKQVLGVA